MNKDITTLYADTANHLLYAGGSFTTAGGKPANNIAYWDGSQWNAMGQGINGFIWRINKFQGNIYVGGDFTTADGHPCKSIAYWGCCTGVNELQNKSQTFKLYPNPNNGTMYFSYSIAIGSKASLVIYDILGRQISTYNLQGGDNILSISENSLRAGIYYYRCTVDNILMKTDKVVIIH